MRLSEFVGNRPVVRAIGNMLQSGRLPHAILIGGEKGLGRHTLAQILAAGAVCTGQTPPCGDCRECRLAGQGTHPDIAVIEPDGAFIKVEQIRALRQAAFVLPNQAARRVFILDGADKMNDTAANALLKVLEEPPATAMFILLAERPSALLETILSRCVCFTLSAPEPEAAAACLLQRAEGWDETAVHAAAAAAGGNIGAAIELLGSKDETGALCADLLCAAESGSELDTLRLLRKLEGKDTRRRTGLVLQGLKTELERRITAKAAGKVLPAGTAGGGIPLPRLMKMLAGVEAAESQNLANAGTALLLTNLCACFHTPIDV